MRDIITQNKLKTEKALREAFVGKVVNHVRYMTEAEANALYWSKVAPVVCFEGGAYILPTTDDEGNNAGAFLTSLTEQEVASPFHAHRSKSKACINTARNINKALSGQKVKSVRYVMPSQAVHLGWGSVSVMMTFESGDYLITAAGNLDKAGGLFTSEEKIESIGVYPII